MNKKLLLTAFALLTQGAIAADKARADATTISVDNSAPVIVTTLAFDPDLANGVSRLVPNILGKAEIISPFESDIFQGFTGFDATITSEGTGSNKNFDLGLVVNEADNFMRARFIITILGNDVEAVNFDVNFPRFRYAQDPDQTLLNRYATGFLQELTSDNVQGTLDFKDLSNPISSPTGINLSTIDSDTVLLTPANNPQDANDSAGIWGLAGSTDPQPENFFTGFNLNVTPDGASTFAAGTEFVYTFDTRGLDAVPEPSSTSLLAIAFAGLVARRKR